MIRTEAPGKEKGFRLLERKPVSAPHLSAGATRAVQGTAHAATGAAPATGPDDLDDADGRCGWEDSGCLPLEDVTATSRCHIGQQQRLADHSWPGRIQAVAA